MLILDGESARGKTQLANVIQAVVGRENVTQLRTRFLGDRFETFRFLKKTLLVGVDVEPDFLSTKGASVLKGLVGGDWFDAEQKCGTGCFPFQGTFCAVITSNARLRVRLRGDVAAWRRRLLIVRYEAQAPKKKIPDFGAILAREEGSGILNWGIAGLEMVLRDVDQTGDIALTEQQRDIVDRLLDESDSLRLFLQDRIEKSEGGDMWVNEIVEIYAVYCAERVGGRCRLPRFTLARRADAGAFPGDKIPLRPARRPICAGLLWSQPEMSLNISKLENVYRRGKRVTARCPACAESGHDRRGEHLVVSDEGPFACVVYPGDSPDAKAHRKRIFALCGSRDIKTLNVRFGPGEVRKGDQNRSLRTLRTGVRNSRAGAERGM